MLQLGEEFEETTVDGRVVTGLVVLEEGKIISRQTAKKAGEKSTITTRTQSSRAKYFKSATFKKILTKNL